MTSRDSPTSWSTEVHVRRWQEGESQALEALCQRFTPLLRSRIVSSGPYQTLTRDCSLDDLVQEVWATVLERGKSYVPSGRGSFAAWLGRVSDRVLVDRLRERRALKRGGDRISASLSEAENAGVRWPVSPPGPATEARSSEFERAARRVLTERELKAWTWVAMQGFSSEEVAFGLGTTPAAVRSLMVRSRRKLREMIRRMGQEASEP